MDLKALNLEYALDLLKERGVLAASIKYNGFDISVQFAPAVPTFDFPSPAKEPPGEFQRPQAQSIREAYERGEVFP